MLKIHCWPVGSQRKAVSGVVEAGDSSTFVTIPCMIVTRLKLVTTPAVPMDTPFASQTANFAGTVEPCFQTLDPSTLIGCRIWWPASPAHMPLVTLLMVKVVDT